MKIKYLIITIIIITIPIILYSFFNFNKKVIPKVESEKLNQETTQQTAPKTTESAITTNGDIQSKVFKNEVSGKTFELSKPKKALSFNKLTYDNVVLPYNEIMYVKWVDQDNILIMNQTQEYDKSKLDLSNDGVYLYNTINKTRKTIFQSQKNDKGFSMIVSPNKNGKDKIILADHGKEIAVYNLQGEKEKVIYSLLKLRDDDRVYIGPSEEGNGTINALIPESLKSNGYTNTVKKVFTF
jgi:hypothetical protein